jgi:copper(I)-binding protein
LILSPRATARARWRVLPGARAVPFQSIPIGDFIMTFARNIFLAATLAACSWFAVSAASAQSGKVIVENPFARPSAGTAGAGAAYMTIRNPGPADRLLSAATSAAGRVELHDHIREGDVMKMRKIDSIPVPAQGAAELKPGGLHVMLLGLSQPLKTGDAFALTLTFEKAGAMTIQVPVKETGAGAPMPHGMPKQHGMPKH